MRIQRLAIFGLAFGVLALVFQNCSGFIAVFKAAPAATSTSSASTTESAFGISSPQDCTQIAPSTSGATNSDRINACLASGDAHLSSGRFPLAQAIVVPKGRTLSGATDSPSLLYADGAAYPNEKVISVHGSIAYLHVSGNGKLVADPTASIIKMEDDGSHASSVELFNLDPVSLQAPAGTTTVIGVYFLTHGRALVENSFIHDVYHGAIFWSALTSADQSEIKNSEILRSSCDSISMPGFGIVTGNQIHGGGVFCDNGPIPAAGIYSLNNQAGALIQGNHIWDMCGNGLDFVGARGFNVSSNTVEQIGSSIGGKFGICVGASPANLVDLDDSSFSGNVFHLLDAPALGLFLDLYPAFANDTSVNGQSIFASIPNYRTSGIAVRLYQGHGSVGGNTFTQNRMIGTYDNGAGIGVGLFVGPGASGGTFSGNDFFGSNIGTVGL